MTFEDNRAKSGAGLDLGDFTESTTSLDAAAVTFARNQASVDGGGIHGQSVAAKISRGVFSDNRAGRNGGALSLSTFTPRSVILANTMLVQNQAGGLGSALIGNSMKLVNSTVADNQGIALSLFTPTPASFNSIELVNTVVSQNTGGNCSPGLGAAQFLNSGNNLQFPAASCGNGIQSADPQLGGVYAPIAGSPAYAGGNVAICAAQPISNRDVFGQLRQIDGFCTIGAVEREPEDKVKQTRAAEPPETTPPYGKPPYQRPPYSRPPYKRQP